MKHVCLLRNLSCGQDKKFSDDKKLVFYPGVNSFFFFIYSKTLTGVVGTEKSVGIRNILLLVTDCRRLSIFFGELCWKFKKDFIENEITGQMKISFLPYIIFLLFFKLNHVEKCDTIVFSN